MLRGRRDRHHRLGLLIPLTVAAIATPIQFAVGDTAARAIANDQPIKFAAMECVQKTSTDVTEYICGRCTSDGVKGGIGIPGFDSFLVGWSTDTEVTGLDTVPPDDRPPANTMLHWAFDTMVGICTVLIAARAVARHCAGGAGATSRRRRWFLRAVAVSGVAAIVALECGWIVTEVGRQPWIVYDVMRTEDAVTDASGVSVTLAAIVLLYAALGIATVVVLRAMSRRWREADDRRDRRALRAASERARERWSRVEQGGRRRRGPLGRRDPLRRVRRRRLRRRVLDAARRAAASAASGPRALIDWAIGPVWEANHVWLIFVLVVLWTAFSTAFESIMSTLFIPLSLAAFGIVLRGLGLCLSEARAEGPRPARRRVPLRALVGAHALLHGHRRRRDRLGAGSGRQRRRGPRHELAQPGLAPGRRALRRDRRLPVRGLPDQRRPPLRRLRRSSATSRCARSPRRSRRARSRSRASSSCTTTRATSTTGLTDEALPLVILSAALRTGRRSCCSSAARVAARARSPSAPSSESSGAGASPSSPICCREKLTISDGAAPSATLTAVLVVFGAALLLVIPALALLYTLAQRSMLLEGESESPGG